LKHVCIKELVNKLLTLVIYYLGGKYESRSLHITIMVAVMYSYYSI